MKSKLRIASIIEATNLDVSITGLQTFNLSELNLDTGLDFQLPTNIRLGHLAESIVSELIKSSSNYNLLYENIQIIENKNTIGEIDFIVENITSNQVIHLELAYKFYLFDPNISSKPINNWIGPNRNDSLVQKLDKLKRKQFPLLYHDRTKSMLQTIDIDEVSQSLCLLTSLFVPYEYNQSFSPSYEKCIKGYYLTFETFTSLDHLEKTYHFPSKKKWGVDPSENEIWTDYNGIEKYLNICMEEKQAPLCWQKHKGNYITFFIVWW